MEAAVTQGAGRRLFLGWMASAACAPVLARSDATALMLASEAPPEIDPAGYLVSEKYDGVRALWDGSRLRFRSGLAVAAPKSFLDRLPAQPLDGELWLARGRFEALVGSVRRTRPDEAEWARIRYMVFDLPGSADRFAGRARRIEALAAARGASPLVAVRQERVADREALARRLDEVLRGGGEGLVLHRADALWQPGRSADLLKLKPQHDAEALVLAVEPGRGRNEGRMGALLVRSEQGIEFRIGSGFSDAERDNPPPPGSTVTYRWRGTTLAGVPRFASYLRLREF